MVWLESIEGRALRATLALVFPLAVGGCFTAHDVAAYYEQSPEQVDADGAPEPATDAPGSAPALDASEVVEPPPPAGPVDPAAGAAGGAAPLPIATACDACQGASTLLGDFPPCCTPEGSCGIDMGTPLAGAPMCLERSAPGALTPACPSASAFGLVSLPGCCRPSGTCGLYVEDWVALGCADAELVGMVVPGAGGTSTPIACVAAPP